MKNTSILFEFLEVGELFQYEYLPNWGTFEKVAAVTSHPRSGVMKTVNARRISDGKEIYMHERATVVKVVAAD